MNNTSSNHHYLPEFYVKNFCNSDGKIFINKKLNSYNYDNIRSYYPGGIFYESGRNTFKVNGKKNVAIEDMYQTLENKIAPILFRLMENEAIAGNMLEVETLRYLLFFAYLQKWRVPISDQNVKRMKEMISFEELNLHGLINNEKITVDEILHDEVSQEFKRILASGALFTDKEQYNRVFERSFILSFPQPLFLTDNPFVELFIDMEKTFPSFIFPISSRLLLVHCDFIDKMDFMRKLENSPNYDQYIQTLYKSAQITFMWHAQNLIGCESRDQLEYYLSIVPELSEKAEDEIIFVVFNILKHYDKIL